MSDFHPGYPNNGNQRQGFDRSRDRGQQNYREQGSHENWRRPNNRHDSYGNSHHGSNNGGPPYAQAQEYGQYSEHRRERSKDRGGKYRSSSGSRWDNRGQGWSKEDLVYLSKTLSSILRHNADRFGFKLMKGGFLYVDDIIHQMRNLHGFSVDDVLGVVHSNDKQRFSVEQDEDGRWKIRANQGHSLEVDDLDLKPITNAADFEVVIHGTYYAAWDMIRKTGLKRMKRNHIHFAPGVPGEGGVISGMRSTCEVMIYLDLEKALESGLKFFLSANNVILSPGDEKGFIRPCYFKDVADRRHGHSLLNPEKKSIPGLPNQSTERKSIPGLPSQPTERKSIPGLPNQPHKRGNDKKDKKKNKKEKIYNSNESTGPSMSDTANEKSELVTKSAPKSSISTESEAEAKPISQSDKQNISSASGVWTVTEDQNKPANPADIQGGLQDIMKEYKDIDEEKDAGT